jgi:hypothetical protein
VVRRNGRGSGEARHDGDVEVNRGSAEQREAEGRRRGRAGNLVGDGKKPMAPGVVPQRDGAKRWPEYRE